MLVPLFDWLSQYYSGFNLFQYLTVRSIFSVLTALAISLLFGEKMIVALTNLKMGQPIRGDGPQTHLAKAGTPTMGGALILLAITVSTLLWSDLSNHYVWVVLFVTIGSGVIGGYDDYLKLKEKNSKGLSSKLKYLGLSFVILDCVQILLLAVKVEF